MVWHSFWDNKPISEHYKLNSCLWSATTFIYGCVLYAHILWGRQFNYAESKKTVHRLNGHEIHVSILIVESMQSETAFLHLLHSLLLTCNGYIRKNNKNQLLYLLENKACLETDHMQWYTHENKNTQNTAWDFNSSIFATSWHRWIFSSPLVFNMILFNNFHYSSKTNGTEHQKTK